MRCSACPIKDGPCVAQVAGHEFVCGMAERGIETDLKWIAYKSSGETPEVVRPSLMQMAVNFTTAVVTQVAAGNPKASAEVQAVRKTKCEACPFLKANQCQKCGCTAMDMKRSWATSYCPIGEWLAVGHA